MTVIAQPTISFPSPVQKLARPIRAAYKQYHHWLWAAKDEVVLLSGPEKNSGELLAVAFAGSHGAKTHVSRLAFSQPPHEESLGRHWMWQVKNYVKTNAPQCDLLIHETPKPKENFFAPHGDFTVPCWIRIEMDISRPLEEAIKHKKYRDMMRKIRNGRFTWEARKDEASFDHFYFKMYLPYVRARHQNAVMVHDHSKLRQSYASGELVMVMKEGSPVGGGLINYSGERGHFMEMGIENAEEQLLKEGVADAIYLFCLSRMKEMGVKKANLGHSRGFLSDGALKYKLALGGRMTAQRLEDPGSLQISCLKMSAGLRNFLSYNPFISLEGEARIVTFDVEETL